jgi:hypothetical protein
MALVVGAGPRTARATVDGGARNERDLDPVVRVGRPPYLRRGHARSVPNEVLRHPETTASGRPECVTALHPGETLGKRRVRTVALVDVALVPWPSDDETRHLLASTGQPRLLLVEATSPPPTTQDLLEDWIRVPASEADLRSRIEMLRWRASGSSSAPTIDEHGVLRHGPTWVLVPPVEARLATALVQRFGTVVSRDALSRAGWPQGAPGRNALDVHVLRLRRRIHTVGLAIRTIRSRGYLLEAAPVSHPVTTH